MEQVVSWSGGSWHGARSGPGNSHTHQQGGYPCFLPLAPAKVRKILTEGASPNDADFSTSRIDRSEIDAEEARRKALQEIMSVPYPTRDSTLLSLKKKN
jgi:hypothetical protein